MEHAERAPVVAPTRRARWLWALGLLLLFATALCQRVLPATEVVNRPSGEVHLLGGDAYYHVRHSRFVVQNFPVVQRFDVGTHFPYGTRSVAGLYDVLLGGVTRLLYGAEASDGQLLVVAAWAPACLGALTLVVLALCAARLSSWPFGLLAGALALLHPGEQLIRSLYGFADHHVAEVLLWIAMVMGIVRCLQREHRGVAPGMRPDLLSTAPLVAFLFTWHGAPLHVAVACVALAGVALAALACDRDDAWLARALARYGLSAALVTGALALALPWLIIDLRLLALALAALLALGVVVPLALRWLAHRARPVRLAFVALSPLLALACALAALPHAGTTVNAALHTKTATIGEHGAEGLAVLMARYGVVLPAVTLAVPWLALRLARHGGAAWAALVALLTSVLFSAASIALRDYRYVMPIAVALVAALAAAEVWRSVAERTRRVAALVAVVAVVAPPLLGLVDSPVADAQAVADMRVVNAGWYEAGRWIARETPTPAVPPDARYDVGLQPLDRSSAPQELKRSYALITPWDDGHFAAALAHRAVLFSQYPSRKLARWWLRDDEQDAYRRMRDYANLPYVIAEPYTVGHRFAFKVAQAREKLTGYLSYAEIVDEGQRQMATTFSKKHDATLVSRLYLDSGMTLGHFRLVYETTHETFVSYYTRKPEQQGAPWGVTGLTVPLDDVEQRIRYAPLVGRAERWEGGYSMAAWIEPTIKVFEMVEGATVQGRTVPGATVVLELKLESSSGRQRRYRRTTVADGEGRFAIRVSQATTDDTGGGQHPSALRSERAYLAVAHRDGEPLAGTRFAVPLSRVLAGDAVDIGVLLPEPAASDHSAPDAGPQASSP